ncbi:MAG TPA: nucleotide exchange factor GrpE [candidate division WWE3 bacterium]|uniref:Protein GrpE n=1 Tax=candidate division WWE3 bacterium TaxID=2053526 RepID=A0A7V5MH64_UNCKA|nr:nucleotide exchange factor GrpE [candidate division WWE3 bacterium]
MKKEIPQSKSALVKEVKRLKKQVEELEKSWKRALADYQNLRKRLEKERDELDYSSKKTIFLEILEVFNNLQMVSDHLDDKGLEITIKHFADVLYKLGLKEIDVEGKPFDPTLAEAVEVAQGEENKVLKVIRKGYIYRDRVIVPARVVVGKSKK